MSRWVWYYEWVILHYTVIWSIFNVKILISVALNKQNKKMFGWRLIRLSVDFWFWLRHGLKCWWLRSEFLTRIWKSNWSNEHWIVWAAGDPKPPFPDPHYPALTGGTQGVLSPVWRYSLSTKSRIYPETHYQLDVLVIFSTNIAI